jgi:hypothetical protein
MSALRSLLVYLFGAAVAVVAFFAAAASSQEADEEPAVDSGEIEEIVVVARKPGSRKKIDDIYLDPVRARVLKDLHEMQKDQEEYEWRTAKAVANPPRISWGYDPTDDYYKRQQLSLEEEAWGKTKPATLFKIGF